MTVVQFDGDGGAATVTPEAVTWVTWVSPVVSSMTWVSASLPTAACPGCGYSHLTQTVDPYHPHNQAECAAWRRGFEAGQAAAKALADKSTV